MSSEKAQDSLRPLPYYSKPYHRLSFNASRNEIHISNGAFCLKLSSGDLYNILILMMGIPKWRNVVCTLVNADPESCVAKGECPFPFNCSKWSTCKLVDCNADNLFNGEPWKRG